MHPLRPRLGVRPTDRRQPVRIPHTLPSHSVACTRSCWPEQRSMAATPDRRKPHDSRRMGNARGSPRARPCRPPANPATKVSRREQARPPQASAVHPSHNQAPRPSRITNAEADEFYSSARSRPLRSRFSRLKLPLEGSRVTGVLGGNTLPREPAISNVRSCTSVLVAARARRRPSLRTLKIAAGGRLPGRISSR
jgi:hypothetical protein